MFDVFIMDMGGHDSNIQYLQHKFPHAKLLRWTDHLHTIRRAVPQSRTRYCWIVSSCIDYQDFDWTWEPAPWESHQIHCWPSGNQKFGDTFLVPCDHWNQQESVLEKLEDYRDVNFEHHSLPRISWQRLEYQAHTVPEVMKQSHVFQTPYVILSNDESVTVDHDPWLWREQPVVSVSTDNGVSMIPRGAWSRIQKQVYDYQWLEKVTQHQARCLDIVFISNGEHGADHHWQILNETVSGLGNRVHRVDGVQGRVACYQAAARASGTDWFFAVFAKLQVNPDFDWRWQPDRWQESKHYIFHAYNPVNHLIYGHQAMIAYNKKLVLENAGTGLDFTLEQPHEVVPMISGTTYYDNDPWTCWRTAFREAIKLRHSLPDVENEYRLQQWLTIGEGSNGHWSTCGANDAMDYYDSVAGNFDDLRKTYEWDWLCSYAMIKRPQALMQSKT